MSGTVEPLARFLWLPPGARPKFKLPRAQEHIFLLLGLSLLFSGYDLNIYGLALPQIQASLHIPEDMVGPTVGLFRLAAIPAFLLAISADVFGRRRLLLITVFGEAAFTIATAFAQNYVEFVWLQVLARLFGYCEELLCFVVVIEEIDERVRGWSSGMLGAMGATGAGIASLAFAAVNILPYRWRALYFLGGGTLLILAYFRRWLKETKRFEVRREELAALGSKWHGLANALSHLLRDYPRRLLTVCLMLFSFGFAIGPSTVLMAKYLQQTHHYAPFQVTLLYVFGGLISVGGNIAAGRISDRLGRKRVLLATGAVSGIFFAVFFSGIGSLILPLSWILALFGYLAADALMAGYAVEMFPTAYRATISGIRYLVSYIGGAAGLALEGPLYNWLGAHGPAISCALLLIPLTLVSILFLPETAGRKLEEISAEV
jgi:MFS family permease